MTPTDAPGESIRLPANDLEQLVISAVMSWAADKNQVLDAIGWGDAKAASDAIAAGQALIASLKLSARDHLGRCVRIVEVGPLSVRVALDLVGCGMPGPRVQTEFGLPPVETTLESPVIEVPAERKRAGLAARLIIGAPGAGQIEVRHHTAPKQPDQTMLALLARARDWFLRLTRDGQSLGQIAQAEQVTAHYVGRIIHVALLAPDIRAALEQGDHPPELTATKLSRMVPLPIDWAEQRLVLGLA